VPAPAPIPAMVIGKFSLGVDGADGLSRWSWGPTHNVSTLDQEHGLIVSSTDPHANPGHLSVVPSIRIPEQFARLSAGRIVRVMVVARTVGADEFGVAYVVEGNERLEWTIFRNLDTEYREYVFDLEPADTGLPHHLCIWGDPTGKNLAVVIRSIDIAVEEPLDRDDRGYNQVDGVIQELRQWSYDKLYKECDVALARLGLDWVRRLRTHRSSRDNWLGREDHYLAALDYGLLDNVLEWRRATPPPGAEAFNNADRRVVIGIPVWGAEFIQCLTDILLPSLLAEGNLPGLAKRARVLLYILAPTADAVAISNHPICALLRQYAQVEFVFVNETLVHPITNHPEDGRRYWLYGALHQISVYYAQALGADIFLLNPDTIYAQNSLVGLYALGEKGADAIVFTSLRLKRSAASRQFREYLDNDGAIRLDGVNLANIAVEFIHPVHRRCFMHPENRDFLPRMVNLQWEVPNAIVMHAAHLQPHFLSRRALARLSGLDYNTVDTRLISRMFVTSEELRHLYVLPCMRDICYFELTPEERVWPSSGRSFPNDRFAEEWFWPSCSPLNELLFQQRTEIVLENQPYVGLRSRESLDKEFKALLADIDRVRPR